MLKPFGQIRRNECATAFLMFLYSFLVMAAYNVIKPATRSKFIESLGPNNLPYVQLVAGALIGFVMAAYSWLIARLPRRWSLSIAQGGIAVVLLVFWFLFRTEQAWVSAAFYLVGLILGILLLSQFWTLANVVFDPAPGQSVCSDLSVRDLHSAAFSDPTWLEISRSGSAPKICFCSAPDLWC